MKKHPTIHEVLGFNRLQYLNHVAFQYNLWCEVLSNMFYVPVRELQSDLRLWNWFCAKWETHIEGPFLEDNKAYILSGVKAPENYWQLFRDKVRYYTEPIPVYPSPIVNAIKQNHYRNLQKQ